MLTRRVIPCLDVRDGRVVKGVRFQHLRDAGDPAAQAAYGAMLIQGRGVPKDNFQGLMWLRLAKLAGDRNADSAYTALAATQTAQTMARVEQAADQWTKRRSPPPVASIAR